MNQRAKELAERLRQFNDKVIAFVEGCSAVEWKKKCAAEDWSVGVTIRHIGAGHYAAADLARMIVKGEKLPELTVDQLTRMANDHAKAHADCTPEEVAGILKKNGQALIHFAENLSEEELDRTGKFSLADGDISTQQFIEFVVLNSGGEHFASAKAATER